MKGLLVLSKEEYLRRLEEQLKSIKMFILANEHFHCNLEKSGFCEYESISAFIVNIANRYSEITKDEEDNRNKD